MEGYDVPPPDTDEVEDIYCVTHDIVFKNWKSAYMHSVYNEGCVIPKKG